jgi:hypothetical protein
MFTTALPTFQSGNIGGQLIEIDCTIFSNADAWHGITSGVPAANTAGSERS